MQKVVVKKYRPVVKVTGKIKRKAKLGHWKWPRVHGR